jgi:hypothetical protein
MVSREKLVVAEILGFLIALVSAIVIASWKYKLNLGYLEWDSAAFLENAAIYAGFHKYDQAIDPTRPPVIPMLLAVGYYFAGPNMPMGFMLSAAFYVIAMLGCYFLARECLGIPYAIPATTMFGLAPMVFRWSVMVISDVEGVAMAAWTLICVCVALKGRPKLIYLSVTMIFLTFLTRYALGAVFLFAIVYVVASKKVDWVMGRLETYYSLPFSVFVSGIVGSKWIAYPVLNHLPLKSLFPSPSPIDPFTDPAGSLFYFVNMHYELGLGYFGWILVFLLVIGIIGVVYKFLHRDPNLNPMLVALLAWFAVMLLYYSYIWPYRDLRYSTEFVLPATIIALYGLSLMIRGSLHFKSWKKVLSLSVLAIVGVSMAYYGYISEYNVYWNTGVLEMNTNIEMREAAEWLYQHIPQNQIIACNWFTLLRWYAPDYTIIVAPERYVLASSPQQMVLFKQLLSQQNVSYVVYLGPSYVKNATFLKPLWFSSAGLIGIYQVSL